MLRQLFSIFSIAFFFASLLSCDNSEVEESIDCTLSELSLEVVSISYTDCGLSNGEVVVAASQGVTPYTFSMDDGLFQESPFFSDIAPGFHDFFVKDAHGCIASTKTYMGSKEPFPVVIYTKPSGCNENNGEIEVVPLGGDPPYKYQLGENNDDYQTSGLWQNLESGKYSIWVEDANKCFFGVYVTVKTGVKYSEDIANIIDAKCNNASCHGGTYEPDLRELSNIRANRTIIKNSITNGSMPIDSSLTTEERMLIICWLDDDAPDN